MGMAMIANKNTLFMMLVSRCVVLTNCSGPYILRFSNLQGCRKGLEVGRLWEWQQVELIIIRLNRVCANARIV